MITTAPAHPSTPRRSITPARREPTVTAPGRTLEQRMDALHHANEIRIRRAQLKRDLKADRVSFYDLLLAPPPWLDTAKVAVLLLAVPRYGRVKVNKALTRCRISPSKTIGGLTQRQRLELLAQLGMPASNGSPSPLTLAEERCRAA